MISTRDLSSLPGIKALKTLTQSLAILDAILSPEWEYRYYSFNNHWALDEAMMSMRDGSGDSYFALFSPPGAILKGFAHEAPISPYASNPPKVWPGVLDDVPDIFSNFLTEPAFSMQDTTFCIWRTYSDSSWQVGNIRFPDGEDPDGSAELLSMFDGNPKTYQAWAEGYYEQPVDLAAVVHVYEHRPLTQLMVAALNNDLFLDDLAPDIAEVGYPT